MKTLRCKDAGFDCEEVVKAKTEEELLNIAIEHALNKHNTIVTPDMAAQIKTLIKEEI